MGPHWPRQTDSSVTKQFGPGLWAASSVESFDTHTRGVMLPEGVLGLSSGPNAQVPAATFASSLTPGANAISTDAQSDISGKIAIEPGRGHYDLKGIGRWFRSRLDDRNRTALGRGISRAALLPAAQDFDLPVGAHAGRGVGRYAAAVGPNIAVPPDGPAHTIDAVQAIAGFD